MRYLIVRLSAIGDVAVGSAILARIREQPGAHVTWLVGERAADLVRLFPGVDEVLAVDERALFQGNARARARAIASVWRKLLSRRFDVVVIGHADSRYRILTLPLFRTTTHMLRLGPGEGSNPLPGRDRGSEFARLLDGSRATGPLMRRYPLADLSGAFPTAARASGARVVLVPGGARNVMREDALRRWPLASYRALAEQLVAQGYVVVLVGDKSDAAFGREFDGLPVRNEIGAHSLVGSLQLMSEADVVVSHDTGPLHLARLVRTPSVALFGPTNPAEFIGGDPTVTVLWGGEHLACRPCYDGRTFAACSDNLCLRSITVPTVLAAVQAIVARSVRVQHDVPSATGDLHRFR